MLFEFISFFGRQNKHRRFRKLENSNKKQRNKALCTLSEFSELASRGVSTSTRNNYHTAVRSFTRYCGGRDAPLTTLSTDTIKAYERWLHECGVCHNTSSCYLRSLRAIYNKAVAKRKVKDKTPFKNVFTGNEKTRKRSVGTKEIRKLANLKLPRQSPTELAKDLFLFSFYAMGMPFADMAHLKTSQIKDGVLTYYRKKTGKRVTVALEKCMTDILIKYRSPHTDYAFPLIPPNCSPAQQQHFYLAALNRYNHDLKTLSRQAGISQPLTSYVARHSWASIAFEQNIDLPIISKALGHTDTKTTLIYINEIGDKRLTTANRKMLKEVLKENS